MNPTRASDDPGAFAVFNAQDTRKVDGAAYRLTARIAQQSRLARDWDTWMLERIHYELFGDLFPGRAGQLRQSEVTFRPHCIPRPGQILHRLHDVCMRAQEIIQQSEALGADERLPQLLERITMLHADCVVIQPFIDGDKRWARHVLSALLVDIGFGPGTAFSLEVKDRYLDGIDKAIGGHPEQLGNLILDGMLKLREIFQTGQY